MISIDNVRLNRNQIDKLIQKLKVVKYLAAASKPAELLAIDDCNEVTAEIDWD
jgi:hypothetical protein